MATERSASSGSLNNGRRCRLCWGDETDGEKLISPCNCKGSMEFIHFHCLKHWLEVTRQQGRSRRSIRCEICKAKYNTHDLRGMQGEDQPLELMPGLWQDPFTIASFIHGTYRAYVAISGLLRVYAIYRSIHFTSCLPAAAGTPCSMRRNPGSGMAGGSTGGSSSSGSRGAGGWPQQQQRGGEQSPLRHLSVNFPLGQRQAVNQDVLTAIRERFNSATMVQVHWYTALMALTPQPPNADAFAGMALGATIGGMMAQLVFMPMLGSGKAAALGHSCKLLLHCLVRLAAAGACQARGYRLLAAAVRAVLQGRQQWWQQLRWVAGHRHRGGRAAGAAAAADRAVQQQQQQQQLAAAQVQLE